MTQRRCYECGEQMRTERRDYQYKECGLDTVVLKGINVHACPKCGSEEPEIGSVASLHRAIMIDILEKDSVLCGEEIRYLRKMARMTGSQVGKLLGADSTTVSKWETNKRKIGAQSDRVLRLICYAGMLERLVKTKDGIAGDVAQIAREKKSMSIRDILSKIKDRSRGPKRVTIDPAKLAELGLSLDDLSTSEGTLVQ